MTSSHTRSSSKVEIARLNAIIDACDARLPKLQDEIKQLENDRRDAIRQRRELNESIRFPLEAMLIVRSKYLGGAEKSRTRVRCRLTATQIVIPGYGEDTERRFSRKDGYEMRRSPLDCYTNRVELLTDETETLQK